MSGERLVKPVGILALVTICAIFLISSAAVAEGEDEDNDTELLDQANYFHDIDNDTDEDFSVTIKLTIANAGAQTRYEPYSEEYIA